jgi:NAD(P)-dependent dehydrogenase (short-subunit alcohol dehydrogenase family)
MNILITGCSRGIGLNTLEFLLKNNKVKCIFALSSNVKRLPKHKVIIPIKVDFTEDKWFDNVLDIIKDEAIHCLINNAGYLFNGITGVIPKDEIDKMFLINYMAPVDLVQGLLCNLKLGRAHIVNIGSMGGYIGSSKFPGLSVYSSTKAAIGNLSECWAEELKEFGITSNCLALGAVNTEMLNEAFPSYKAPVSSIQIARVIVDFSLSFNRVMNGKIVPISFSTP